MLKKSKSLGLSWSNWNLEMLVFVEGGKPENPEKDPQSKARISTKLNPHNTKLGWHSTWAVSVEG